MKIKVIDRPLTPLESFQGGPGITGPSQQPLPSLLEVGGAAFRHNNTIGSYFFTPNTSAYGMEPPEDYDWTEGMEDEEYDRLMPIWSVLDNEALNHTHRDKLIAKYEQEQRDREILASRPGAALLWEMGATLTDPVYLPLLLAPPAAFARALGAGTKAGFAVRAGGALAAEEAVQETILQQQQVSRTWSESLFEIGAAGVFGGAITGLLGVGIRDFDAFVKAADSQVKDLHTYGGLEPVPTFRTRPEWGSGIAPPESSIAPAGAVGRSGADGGARVVDARTLEGESAGTFLFGAEKVFKDTGSYASAMVQGRWTPLTRLLGSESVAARAFVNDTVRHNFYTGNNMIPRVDPTGRPVRDAAGRQVYDHFENRIPLEVKIQQERKALTVQYDKALREKWRAFNAKHGGKTIGHHRVLFQGPMSFRKFNDEVGKAMRRGDEHAIPEVAEAAKMLRETLISPMVKRYQDAGLLPEDIPTKYAESYFSRVYNTVAIRKDYVGWTDTLTKHFREVEMAARRRAFIDDRVQAAREQAVMRGDMEADDAALEIAIREATEEFEAANPMPREFPIEDTATLRRMEQAIEDDAARVADLEKQLGEAEKAVRAAEKVAKKAGKDLEAKQYNLDYRESEWVYGDPMYEKSGAKTVSERQAVLENKARELEFKVRERRDRAASPNATAADRKAAKSGENMLATAKKRVAEGEVKERAALDALAERIVAKARKEAEKAAKRVEIERGKVERLGTRLEKAQEAAGARVDELDTLMARLGDNAVKTALARRQGRLDAALKTARTKRAPALAAQMRTRWLEEGEKAAREAAEKEAGKGSFFDEATMKDVEAAARDRADRATQNILRPDNRKTQAGTTAPDLLKERVLQIPDEILEPWLIHDADYVLQHFVRRTTGELAFIEKYGSTSTEAIKEAVRLEYNNLKQAANMTSDRLAQLDAMMARDHEDIDAVADLLMNRYVGHGDESDAITNTTRFARTLSYVSLLGGMVLSALPDLHRPLAQYGWRATAKALGPQMMMFSKQARMQARQWREAGVAAETVLNSRAFAIGMVDDNMALSTTQVANWMRKGSAAFTSATLMNQWNAGLKMWAGRVIQNRMYDDIMNYSRLSPRRKEALAKYGIGQNKVDRYRAQLEQHGKKIYGSWDFNTRAWDDDELVNELHQIIFRETENTIVTPGIGDRPVFMNSQIGATLMQFKSFFFASWNQATLQNAKQLRRGQLSALGGIMMAGALAWFVELSKLAVAGRWDDLQYYNERDFIRAVIDRSGLMAIPMEMFNIADSFMAGGISKSMGMDMKGLRYFDRNFMGVMAGPAFGYITDAGAAAQSALLGDFTKQDAHRIRKLSPLQNLFYMRGGFNWLEEQLTEDLPDTGYGDRRLNR